MSPELPERTVPTLLEESARKFAELPALHQPLPGKKKYRTYSWREYYEAALETAAGLRTLRIGKSDVVAIHAETRAEFYLADLGILTNGSVSAALYTSFPPAERVRMLRACHARAIFVEDPAVLEEIRGAADPPLPVCWILLNGTAEGAITFEELREHGRRLLAEEPGLQQRLREEIEPDDPAILYLTSGATGESKMALVSHRALVANMDMGPQVLRMDNDDCVLAFLPPAHITQRVVAELLPIPCGIQVWFSAGLRSLPGEMQSVKPTLFVAPPRFWERIYASVRAEVRKRPKPMRSIFYMAVGIGLEAVRLKQAGKSLPPWLSTSLKMADKVALHKVRERFGGRMKLCASGSAPLGRHLAEFFAAVGLPMAEGYGLTEGGVLILTPEGKPRAGYIGKPLPGVEVKLAKDGELLVKSPTIFLGYYNDPEATQSVYKDGWLATGDLAEIDKDGYIAITGRKKEIIVASNGKKIYPARIETLFKTEPLISHVVPLGDGQPNVSALITVNRAEAEALEGMEAYRGKTDAEVAAAPPVFKAVQAIVKMANQHLADFEQIRKFKILEREFSIERGELTPTLKVRRARVMESFRKQVEELTAGRD